MPATAPLSARGGWLSARGGGDELDSAFPAPSYRQGDRCVVNGSKQGTVMFVGRVPALGAGAWVGV